MFPRLLELGPVTLHTYGLLLATGYLSAISLAARLASRDGIPRNVAWDLGFVTILCALAGAKILLVLTDLERYLSEPSRLLSMEFWQAGGVYYGGFLAAVAGSIIFASRSPRLRFWPFADAAAPAIALGQSIGRLGCFAAGCDYGSPSQVPWAVTFTSEYAHRYVGVPLHVALHPSQLYESAATFLIFGALLWVFVHRGFQGQAFSAYLILYGVARFCLEFFRGDEGRGFVLDGLLSTSQLISLLMVPAGIVLYFHLRGKQSAQHRV